MSRPRLVHVDDSLTAIRLLEAQVKALRPDLELESFRSIADACDGLTARLGRSGSADSSAADTPWLVVTDVNLPGRLGTELVIWLRRHPLLHQTPVAMLSASGERGHEEFSAAHGVLRWLGKPASDGDVAELLRDRERMAGSIAVREALEREFVVAGVQAVDAMISAVERGAETGPLFHQLHSFKGEAAALLFPDLARLAHAMETFVSRAREAGYRRLLSGTGPLREGLAFLREQLARFGQRRPEAMLAEPPARLLLDLEALGRNLPPSTGSVGALPGGPGSSSGSAGLSPPPTSTWEPPDLGIDISSFERLQEKVRSVLKRSARVSEKVRDMAQASPNETMTELLQLVKKLDHDCIEMVSTLVSYFTVRGERIAAFLTTVVSEVSRHCGNRAALELDINPELEIDQAVYSSLKTIFVHLVRNALDHGIESAEERLRVGKPAAGLIRVAITPERRFRYRVVFEDDGRGIDIERLKREAASRGVIASANDTKALELIFVDELTTKSSATTLSGRGMGMGAIRRMIEARNGTISVASRVGAGTRFEITLTKVLKLQ